MSSAATIPVSAGGDYNVTVGRDLLLGTDVLTDALAGVKKVLIVHQHSLELVAGELRDALADDFTVLLAEIPDAEAAKPFVYATALLLILVVVTLNLTAILIRNRLKKRFAVSSF
jgi:3-dehydroquinate synthetase